VLSPCFENTLVQISYIMMKLSGRSAFQQASKNVL